MQKTRKIMSMLLAVLMVLSMCTVGMMSVSAASLPEGAVINDVEGNDASNIDGEIFGLLGDADLNDKINVRDATEMQKFAAKLVELTETAEALADVDLNGKVNVKDATAVQKWIAKFDVEQPINCLVYIPAEETTVTTAPTEPATDDEPTTAASVDETEPTASVPVIIIPTTVATAPTTTTATDATEPTTQATEPTIVTTVATVPTTVATEPTTATDAPDDGTVTVYFQNNWMWSDVSVHMWTANGDVTTWPGSAMTFVENDGNYDIYSVVVSDDVVGMLFNGIKDDGTGTLDQTPDILEWYDGQCFYNVWDSSLNEGAGGNNVDSFQYIVPTEPTTAATQPTSADTQPTTTATDDETEPTSSTTEPTSEATQPAGDTTVTVYFTNNKGWEVVNVHAWNADGDITAWPGVAMEYYETNSYGQDVYKYTFNVAVDGVVFDGKESAESSKGNEYQTVSIKGDALVDGYGYYPDTQDDSGKWTVGSWVVEEKDPVTTAATQPTSEATQPTTDATDATESTTAAKVESNYEVRGSFNDWNGQVMYLNADGSASLTIELAAGEYTFKIYDTATSTWYGNDGTIEDTAEGWTFKEAGDCTLVATGGTYTFKAYTNAEGKFKVDVTKGVVVDPTEATTAATQPTTEATTAATEPTTEATTVATQPTTEGPVVAPEAPAPAAVAIDGSYGGTGTEEDPFLVAPSVKMTMIITGELGDADGLGYNVNYYRSFVEWEVGQTSVSYNGVKAPALDATQAVNVYLIAYNVAENGEHLQSATYTTTTIWVKGAEEPATEPTTEATTAATEPTTEATTAATEPTTEATQPTTATQVESKYEVRGSFNDWNGQVMYLNADDSASATLTLDAGTYEFKIYDGTSWYGNGGSFEDSCSNWGFRSAVESNCTLIASGGTYTFTVVEASESIRVTVTKETVVDPTEATTVATEPTSETTTAATEPTSEATTATTEPTTPDADTVTITFNAAKTTWVSSDGAIVVLVDNDTNTTYTMTAGSNSTYTAEVPATVVNITFNRNNPATGTAWNYWTAGDRGEAVQYNTTGSGTGAWAGDTTVKFYVMGSFNNWSTGEAMKANADGSYTQEIELAAGTYEYKIATADWSTEYPSGYQNNATLTVATAGTYVFTLSASGEISAVAK